MVVLMDPMDADHDDVLRANRSREKKFVFDYTFDDNATQVRPNLLFNGHYIEVESNKKASTGI